MEEQERTEQSPEDPGTQQILEFGSSLIHSKRGAVHVLTIVGQIEGHQVLPPSSKSTKYEHVMPLLALVEESDEVDGLLVLLNTVGGDIEAGLGIAELIASMSKPPQCPWCWGADIPSGCPWPCPPSGPSSPHLPP